MTTCEAPGCDRPPYSRGHCERHYRQLLRTGELRPDPVPRSCAVDGCSRTAATRGWCHGHYLRWLRSGELRPEVPLRRPDVPGGCSVPGCTRGRHSAQYCRSHEKRLRRYGDPTAGGPLRTSTGSGHVSHGYWKVVVPPHERHLAGGQSTIAEHRLVMARTLGRPLTADERVHHLNGDRLDNRPENLELWSTAQPSGQRVADKLAFAWLLVHRYESELVHFLGGDIDPATGLPYPGSSA